MATSMQKHCKVPFASLPFPRLACLQLTGCWGTDLGAGRVGRGLLDFHQRFLDCARREKVGKRCGNWLGTGNLLAEQNAAVEFCCSGGLRTRTWRSTSEGNSHRRHTQVHFNPLPLISCLCALLSSPLFYNPPPPIHPSFTLPSPSQVHSILLQQWTTFRSSPPPLQQLTPPHPKVLPQDWQKADAINVAAPGRVPKGASPPVCCGGDSEVFVLAMGVRLPELRAMSEALLHCRRRTCLRGRNPAARQGPPCCTPAMSAPLFMARAKSFWVYKERHVLRVSSLPM